MKESVVDLGRALGLAGSTGDAEQQKAPRVDSSAGAQSPKGRRSHLSASATEARSVLAAAWLRPHGGWRGYVWGLLGSAVFTLLSYGALQFLELADVTMLYLLGVVVIATRVGLGPSLVSSFVGVAAFDFFVIPPVFRFTIAEFRHVVTLGGMIGVSIVVSGLTELLRRERARALALVDETGKAYFAAETERVRNALLSSVSHDFRTPLAMISASAQMLARNHVQMNPALRGELLAGIAEQSERLDGLLRNLLAMTRVEAGELRLHTAPGAVEEVVAAAVRRGARALSLRSVEVNAPRGLPLVAMDASLLEQLFVNLLENAARYSPAGSPIHIRIAKVEQSVVVEIEDHGPGVAEDELERVFEKFYRGRQAPKGDGGVGLGLAICRAIALAHAGTIQLRNGDAGAIARVTLPATDVSLRDAVARLPELS